MEIAESLFGQSELPLVHNGDCLGKYFFNMSKHSSSALVDGLALSLIGITVYHMVATGGSNPEFSSISDKPTL
ncbi:hypothetical protein OJ253_1172 [Cryptosporidium canis]|uniref:Uncharacterized protein n=1 Tax=Cryptosporidium canis TaxID=195482 RepID=A0A9D5HY57_9CRYT|nr:hypothetical protein OJ253_1172 [Cryptosporidium canis]